MCVLTRKHFDITGCRNVHVAFNLLYHGTCVITLENIRDKKTMKVYDEGAKRKGVI